MIKNRIDFSKPLRCILYGRMSSDQQNPRSPDQQFDEIRLTIQRQNRPWRVLRTYRDDGISGRLLRKREDFQKMLREIRTGIIQIDAILVDTWERIGRADELVNLRQGLWTRHGVLILTANTQFADPTSEIGKVVGMFEQVRATSANEVKSHEVSRGKRDAAMQKRWPGGPAPFGKKLKKCVELVNGKEITFSILERDPEAEAVVLKILNLAKNNGWGQSRLAKAINADPEVPEEYRPFNEHTIGYILDNPIYIGTLRWGDYSSGVINDTRILRKNPESEVIWVADFCEPIYPRQDWEQIQAVRKERSARLKAALQRRVLPQDEQKQLQPLAPGLTLNYLLTGLVFCAQCNSRMTACSSCGASRSRKRLSYYRCPLAVGGGCSNRRYVREDKLRGAVSAAVRRHLFPAPLDAQQPPTWLAELASAIEQELAHRRSTEPDPRPVLELKIEELSNQMSGWMQSLGKRELAPSLRAQLETQYETASQAEAELRRQLENLQSQELCVQQALDLNEALDRLRRLDQVLASGNVTAGNLELSLHIDRIDVHGNGKVVLRTSKLGIFAGAVDLLAQAQGVETPAPAQAPAAAYQVKSRRRAQLQVVEPETATPLEQAQKMRAMDAGRFAGIQSQWFWKEPLEICGASYWSAENAQRVAAKRSENPKHWSQAKLAVHFAVSIPTIRKALRIALAQQAPTAADPQREQSQSA